MGTEVVRYKNPMRDEL